MADMFDYLDWRGDIPFSQVPFNKIDALLLAQKAKNINLAEDEGFQARYISALNFPDL